MIVPWSVRHTPEGNVQAGYQKDVDDYFDKGFHIRIAIVTSPAETIVDAMHHQTIPFHDICLAGSYFTKIGFSIF